MNTAEIKVVARSLSKLSNWDLRLRYRQAGWAGDALLARLALQTMKSRGL